MQPPTDPQTPAAPPNVPPVATPEPGEPRRVLDHPPSERYAPEQSAVTEATPSQRAARALGVGLVGAAVVALLGGPLSVTLGLVVVAAVIGWAVGSVARPSLGLAIGVAVGSIAVGLVGIWLFARFEGGVLGLPDYFAEVQGPVVLLELAVAGLVAAGTVR